MNLTGQAPYQKGGKSNSANKPSVSQRERWKLIRRLGCLICRIAPELHHAFTGQGGRKDHDKIIPLCFHHHRGTGGIHTLGRQRFAELHGSEEELLERVRRELGE